MIKGIERLAEDTKLYSAVLKGLFDGQEEGWFPADRPSPNGEESCLWIEVGTRVVSFITFYQPDHRPMVWVDLVWVDPDFRKRGHGTELLDAVIMQCRTKSIERVELGTFLHNEAMQALAEGRNFKARSVSYKLDLKEATT